MIHGIPYCADCGLSLTGDTVIAFCRQCLRCFCTSDCAANHTVNGCHVATVTPRIDNINPYPGIPPCLECGALTPKEAATRCRCGGDRDHCHGCDLWPE